MRWLRLVFRIFGWLLTPFLAWAASFFGAVGGALIAMRIDESGGRPCRDGGVRGGHGVRGHHPLAALSPAESRGPRGPRRHRGRNARYGGHRPSHRWAIRPNEHARVAQRRWHSAGSRAAKSTPPPPAAEATPTGRTGRLARRHRAGRCRDLVHPGAHRQRRRRTLHRASGRDSPRHPPGSPCRCSIPRARPRS